MISLDWMESFLRTRRFHLWEKLEISCLAVARYQSAWVYQFISGHSICTTRGLWCRKTSWCWNRSGLIIAYIRSTQCLWWLKCCAPIINIRAISLRLYGPEFTCLDILCGSFTWNITRMFGYIRFLRLCHQYRELVLWYWQWCCMGYWTCYWKCLTSLYGGRELIKSSGVNKLWNFNKQ